MSKGKGRRQYHGNSHANSTISRSVGGTEALMHEAYWCGYQRALDMLALALHDPEVVSKSHVFGERRIVKVYDGIVKYDDTYKGAFKVGKEADYLQEKLDGELHAIFSRKYADQVVPFKDRHSIIFIPGYDKPRKDWV